MRLDLPRERNFRFLLAARAASLLGDMVVPVALTFAVLDLGASATALGAVLAANLVPYVGLLLVGGVWADRLPRRRLMLSADVIRAASQSLMAALVLTGHAEVWELGILNGMEGAWAAFAEPAYAGVVPETVSPAHLQRANALVRLTRSVASIAGPAVAGGLVVAAGPGWGIALDAASFAVSAACIAQLALPARPPGADSPFLSDLRDGFAEVRRRTRLWVMMVDSSLWVMVVQGPVMVLGPIVAVRHLGGASAWAAILTAEGIGAVAGSALGLWLRPARPLLWAVTANLTYTPLAVLLALRAPAPLTAVAAVPAGAAIALYVVLWQTALQEHTPPAALSRVTSIERLGTVGLYPVGLAAAGPAAALIGVAGTLWLAVAWQAVSTTVILSVPDVRGVAAVGSARGARGDVRADSPPA